MFEFLNLNFELNALKSECRPDVAAIKLFYSPQMKRPIKLER